MPDGRAANREEKAKLAALSPEDVYKIYAESFRGLEHLAQVQDAAREVVSAALG